MIGIKIATFLLQTASLVFFTRRGRLIARHHLYHIYIHVNVIRVKSYVNSFFDPVCVPVNSIENDRGEPKLKN